MKKNRLLIFAALLMIIASGVNAQYIIPKSELPQRPQIKQQVYTPVKQQRNHLKTESYAFFGGYNNMVQAIANSMSPNSVLLYATPLTNDTTMKIAYWDNTSAKISYYKPLFMGASCVLDPNTEYFSDYYYDKDYRVGLSSYKIDSIFIRGNYKRVSNSSVVDTLIIELVYGDTSNAFLTLSTTTSPIQYYAAPQWIKDNYAANNMGRLHGNGYKVIKRLLTVNDSILDPNVVKSLPIAINFEVPSKNYVGITYVFKSGVPRVNLPAEPILNSSKDAENNDVYQDINSFSAAYYSHENEDEIFYDPTSLSMNYSITSYHYGQKWSGGASFYNYALYNVADIGWDIMYSISLVKLPLFNDKILEEDKTICKGETVKLEAQYADSYLWSNGATSQSIMVKPATLSSYKVTAYQDNESATDVINITVLNASFNAGSDQTMCNGGAAELTATGSGYYSWSTGSSNAIISVSPASSTFYFVTGTSNTCKSVDTVIVVVNQDGYYNFASITKTQNNDNTVTLTALPASVGITYLWNTESTNQSIIVSSANSNVTYSVTVTQGLSKCYSIASTTLTNLTETEQIEASLSIYPMPIIEEINISFNLLNSDNVNITITDIVGKNIYNENVKTNGTSIVKNINTKNMTKGVYTLKIETQNGNVVQKIIKN